MGLNDINQHDLDYLILMLIHRDLILDLMLIQLIHIIWIFEWGLILLFVLIRFTQSLMKLNRIYQLPRVNGTTLALPTLK